MAAGKAADEGTTSSSQRPRFRIYAANSPSQGSAPNLHPKLQSSGTQGALKSSLGDLRLSSGRAGRSTRTPISSLAKPAKRQGYSGSTETTLM
jgi:hypothetical protein